MQQNIHTEIRNKKEEMVCRSAKGSLETSLKETKGDLTKGRDTQCSLMSGLPKVVYEFSAASILISVGLCVCVLCVQKLTT